MESPLIFVAFLQGMFSNALKDVYSIDWRLVYYRQLPFSVAAVLCIGGLASIKFFWGRVFRREQSAYWHSGFTLQRSDKPSLIQYGIRSGARLLMWMGISFLLVALADPYLVIGQERQHVELREIIYVDDVSASMGFRFRTTQQPRSLIKRKALLKVLAQRRGKGDRSALITFSSDVHLWSTFTSSSDSFLFTVSMAPTVLAPEEAPFMWKGDFIAKDFAIAQQSDTNLHLGLQAAVDLFERKGLPEITSEMKARPRSRLRSVIILTDGAATQDPEEQFRELARRRIVPYLIFIDPAREIETRLYGAQSMQAQLPDQLLMMVRRHGGEYFLAYDEASIDRISTTLDRLHSIRTSTQMKTLERDIYQIPLAVACCLCMVALALRSVAWFAWRVI